MSTCSMFITHGHNPYMQNQVKLKCIFIFNFGIKKITEVNQRLIYTQLWPYWNAVILYTSPFFISYDDQMWNTNCSLSLLGVRKCSYYTCHIIIPIGKTTKTVIFESTKIFLTVTSDDHLSVVNKRTPTVDQLNICSCHANRMQDNTKR